MRPTANHVWLGVSLLATLLILAALESGRLSGLSSPPSVLQNFNFTYSPQKGGGRSGTTSTSSISGTNTLSVSPPHLPGIPGSIALRLTPPFFVIVLILAASIATLAAITLLMRRDTRVLRLSGILDELEQDTEALRTASYSHGRNLAVVRYYALLRKACDASGLGDAAAETPAEYLARIARILTLDPSESESFSRIFNRARYGEALTDSETNSALAFMRSFLTAVRGRLGASSAN